MIRAIYLLPVTAFYAFRFRLPVPQLDDAFCLVALSQAASMSCGKAGSPAH
jgi:hypothetical protein